MSRLVRSVRSLTIAAVALLALLSLAGEAAARSVAVAPRGYALNSVVDSKGRSYTAWSYGSRDYVTVTSKAGRRIAIVSGPGSESAGPPDVRLLDTGIFVAWFGGEHAVRTYTSSGKLIAKIPFVGYPASGSSENWIDGEEGRGGALVLYSDDGDPARLMRISAAGKLTGTMDLVPKAFDLQKIRFAFLRHNRLAVLAAGWDHSLENDYDSGIVRIYYVSADNAVSSPIELSPPNIGGTPYGDFPAVTFSRTTGDDVVARWASMLQTSSSSRRCDDFSRRVSANGSVGPLVELVSHFGIPKSFSSALKICPNAGAVAASQSAATALVADGTKLRVVKVSASGTARRLATFTIGPLHRAGVGHVASTPGHAAVAWGIYSNKTKRTKYTVVAAAANGHFRVNRFSRKLDPAALQDVTIGPDGSTFLLIQRKVNVTGGANLMRFSGAH